MYAKIEKVFYAIIMSLIIIGLFSFRYSITKSRLERIYKIESPTFTEIMLEIWR